MFARGRKETKPARVRGLFRLVDGHAYTCAEVHALMLQHLSGVRRKIEDLRRLERAMARIAAQGGNMSRIALQVVLGLVALIAL